MLSRRFFVYETFCIEEKCSILKTNKVHIRQ